MADFGATIFFYDGKDKTKFPPETTKGIKGIDRKSLKEKIVKQGLPIVEIPVSDNIKQEQSRE